MLMLVQCTMHASFPKVSQTCIQLYVAKRDGHIRGADFAAIIVVTVTACDTVEFKNKRRPNHDHDHFWVHLAGPHFSFLGYTRMTHQMPLLHSGTQRNHKDFSHDVPSNAVLVWHQMQFLFWKLWLWLCLGRPWKMIASQALLFAKCSPKFTYRIGSVGGTSAVIWGYPRRTDSDSQQWEMRPESEGWLWLKAFIITIARQGLFRNTPCSENITELIPPKIFTREEKSVHDHHWKKSFGGTFLATKKTFQAGGGYNKPKNQENHIHHRNLSSVDPIFFCNEKFCTGAGQCMVSFSQIYP